jgi:hypothetical protein
VCDLGGFVINNRVMGELAVSRAFGDSEFKKAIQQSMIEENSDMEIDASNWDQPLIIAEPEVKVKTQKIVCIFGCLCGCLYLCMHVCSCVYLRAWDAFDVCAWTLSVLPLDACIPVDGR